MTNLRSQLRSAAEAYAALHRIQLSRFLGDGNDGAVWESSNYTAIKALERKDSYQRELAALRRLDVLAISSLNGFSVPTIVGFNHRLKIVEMTVVFPPCIIDFAKAYLDKPPDFSAETLFDWETETRELFETEYDRVMELVAILRSLGIYYFDAKPGNIRF